eukprot:2189530-Pleurochrysis_carterae.AAC.1
MRRPSAAAPFRLSQDSTPWSTTSRSASRRSAGMASGAASPRRRILISTPSAPSAVTRRATPRALRRVNVVYESDHPKEPTARQP